LPVLDREFNVERQVDQVLFGGVGAFVVPGGHAIGIDHGWHFAPRKKFRNLKL
jgi:hypothetical protein